MKHFYICVAEFETDIPLHQQRLPEIKFYHNKDLKVKFSIDRFFSDGSAHRLENINNGFSGSSFDVLGKIKCVK